MYLSFCPPKQRATESRSEGSRNQRKMLEPKGLQFSKLVNLEYFGLEVLT